MATRFTAYLRRVTDGRWAETGDDCRACRALDYCGARGCDGRPRDEPVWSDGPVETTVCPVLSLTPDVRAWQQWFRDTHEVVVGDGHAWWQRRDLPGPGGIGQQDSRLMAALSVIAAVETDVLIEQRARARAAAKTRAWRARRREQAEGAA